MSPVIFEDGFLYVDKTNQILQKFLHYHPLNGKIFIEINKSEEAKDEVQDIMLEADALVEAKSLKLDQLETVCRVLFGNNVSNMSTAELKRDVLVYAKNNPQEFLEVISDPDLQIPGKVARFFEEGLLTYRKSNKEVWYNTKTNKNKNA